MKTLLFFSLMMVIAMGCFAQQIQFSNAQLDSLQHKYKQRKTTGLIMLPAGGVALLTGAIVCVDASMQEAGDDVSDGLITLFGGEPEPSKKDYSGKYTTGIALMLGGAIMTAIGITQLSKARNLNKLIRNAHFSVAPHYVPAGSLGAGQVRTVPQTSISLAIPFGK